MFVVQKEQYELYQKYPYVDCPDFDKEYAGNEQKYKHDAISEFIANTNVENQNTVPFFNGPM